MDLIAVINEVGLFEASANLAGIDHSVLAAALDGQMPLPPISCAEAAASAANWLLSFNKTRFMFLTPEIQLIEAMSAQTQRPLVCEYVLPFNVDPEIKGRLQANLPTIRTIRVSTLDEPAFPVDFYPSNGLIVACGFTSGHRAMVLPETYRMLNHYKDFRGHIVFCSVFDAKDVCSFDTWLQAPNGVFSHQLRSDSL